MVFWEPFWDENTWNGFLERFSITWGPFLESPGKFSGPKLYFKIKNYRMVEKLLNRNPARLVSLAYNLTAWI